MRQGAHRRVLSRDNEAPGPVGLTHQAFLLRGHNGCRLKCSG